MAAQQLVGALEDPALRGGGRPSRRPTKGRSLGARREETVSNSKVAADERRQSGTGSVGPAEGVGEAAFNWLAGRVRFLERQVEEMRALVRTHVHDGGAAGAACFDITSDDASVREANYCPSLDEDFEHASADAVTRLEEIVKTTPLYADAGSQTDIMHISDMNDAAHAQVQGYVAMACMLAFDELQPSISACFASTALAVDLAEDPAVVSEGQETSSEIYSGYAETAVDECSWSVDYIALHRVVHALQDLQVAAAFWEVIFSYIGTEAFDGLGYNEGCVCDEHVQEVAAAYMIENDWPDVLEELIKIGAVRRAVLGDEGIAAGDAVRG